ncbi:MAG: hypothetical protein GX362_00300 [Methanosarcinaceae archaeon]|nr:hypothetical protein [Methanosarcinaceae archaeon]
MKNQSDKRDEFKNKTNGAGAGHEAAQTLKNTGVSDSTIFSIFSNSISCFLKNYFIIIPFLLQKLSHSGLFFLTILIFLNISAFSTLNSFIQNEIVSFEDIFTSDFLFLLYDTLISNFIYVILLVLFYFLGKAFINSILKSGVIGTYSDYFQFGKKISTNSFLKHVKENTLKIFIYEISKLVTVFAGLIVFIPAYIFISNAFESNIFLLLLFLTLLISAIFIFALWYIIVNFFFEMGPFFAVIDKQNISSSIKNSLRFPFRFPISFLFIEFLFFSLSLFTSIFNLTGILSIIGALIDIVLLRPLFYATLTRLFLNK